MRGCHCEFASLRSLFPAGAKLENTARRVTVGNTEAGAETVDLTPPSLLTTARVAAPQRQRASPSADPLLSRCTLALCRRRPQRCSSAVEASPSHAINTVRVESVTQSVARISRHNSGRRCSHNRSAPSLARTRTSSQRCRAKEKRAQRRICLEGSNTAPTAG